MALIVAYVPGTSRVVRLTAAGKSRKKTDLRGMAALLERSRSAHDAGMDHKDSPPCATAPVRVITAEEVHALCPWEGLIDALAEAHCGPRPMVGRASLESEGPNCQRFIDMPAWQPGIAMGSKLVTLFPDNPDRAPGLPAVQALYALFDGRNGSPLAVIDGTALTYRKTAADSGLGSRLLSRSEPEVLAMIGAGGLARYLIEAHCAARPSLARVLVWNRRMDKAEKLVSSLAAIGVAASVCELEPAVRAADIVSCATAATTPLIEGRWLKAGAHLDLVGGFTPDMRESDDECVRRARLFVDSRWFAIDQTGDLGDPIRRGIIARDKVEADLFDLCAGKHPIDRQADDITMFKNAGGAHLDLFTALYIRNRLAQTLSGEADT
jgi:ornithine cyclodeaminase/alanine dehydrogenase-like protein (mu-crystallin family)